MKIRVARGEVTVELSGAEARVLYDELADIRGGSKMPKIAQLCERLGNFLEMRSTPLAAYKKKGKAKCDTQI